MFNPFQDIDHVLVSAQEIQSITARLADQINRDYADSPKLVVVSVIKGSIFFYVDLLKQLDIPVELEFIKVSSYGTSTKSSGQLNIQLDLKRENYKDIDILLVEDIVDSGRTLSRLTADLRERGARSVRTVTLLDKPSRREVDYTADYIGKSIPDAFVVGYGLDFNEKYRTLPYIGVLKSELYT